MSGSFIDPDPIRAFFHHGYKQTRDELEPIRITNDIAVIKRIAGGIHSQYPIEVSKVGDYIAWNYNGKPTIYIKGNQLYATSHSREAHENAASVLSILVKNHAAEARRTYPSKKVRMLNEPVRDLARSLSTKDRRLLFHLATNPVFTISVGDGAGQLPRKRVERLAKKGYIVIKQVEGREFVMANPALQREEAILYGEKEKRAIPPLEKIL